MSARHKNLLPGATAIMPLRQGELDRLCGLYSTLNAVRLAVYPRELTDAQELKLFTTGINRLARQMNLRHTVGVGIGNGALLAMARVVAEKAAAITGTSLIIERASNRLTMERRRIWLTNHLGNGNPVLAEFKTADHYSVCCGLTKKRVTIFDSSGGLSTVNLPTGRMYAFVNLKPEAGD